MTAFLHNVWAVTQTLVTMFGWLTVISFLVLMVFVHIDRRQTGVRR